MKKMSNPVHFEKTLSSETLFEGRVITLTKDTALLENGRTATREVVHHHGGACILPYFADGTICMVRQFRYAMQQELWKGVAYTQERDLPHCFQMAGTRLPLKWPGSQQAPAAGTYPRLDLRVCVPWACS